MICKTLPFLPEQCESGSTGFKFLSLASGSSGNCYYFGSDSFGILIDAGIYVKSIQHALLSHKIPLSNISALLITHEHTDHSRAVNVIGGKYYIPVYATEAVHRAIKHNKFLKNQKGIETPVVIEKDVPFSIRDLEITPFDVPHDSIDNVGYEIAFAGQRFTIMTDIGYPTDQMKDIGRRANHLIVESNYSEQMLRDGNYPMHLKQRIASEQGHLSNESLSQYLKDIYHKDLRNIWLCHLSKENNTPALAYDMAKKALLDLGVNFESDLNLEVLDRYTPSGYRVF